TYGLVFVVRVCRQSNPGPPFFLVPKPLIRTLDRMWWIYGLPTWQSSSFGGKDSGGGGKGLSMVELGLWDKNGVEKPVSCVGGKIGREKELYKKESDRDGFGVIGKVGPSLL
ncbi:hypothetical protein Tco_0774388, partial [Tanacetum coccineum]